jgi:hypothetical protein
MRDCRLRGGETLEFSNIKPVVAVRVELDCPGVGEDVVVGRENAPNVPEGCAEAAKGFVGYLWGREEIKSFIALPLVETGCYELTPQTWLHNLPPFFGGLLLLCSQYTP